MKFYNRFALQTSVILLCATLFIGCRNKLPENLTPATCRITGNLGEYFEVVEGEYPISESTSKFVFKVKRIKEPEEGIITKFGIGYAIFDKEGKALIAQKAKLEDLNPLMSLSFLQLKMDETGDISIYIEGWPEKLKGAKTFRIALDCQEEIPASKLISLEEFINPPNLAVNFDQLKEKGFSMSENKETGEYVLEKDNLTIEYFEDFDDDGEGTTVVTITFPELEDVSNFIAPINDNLNWGKRPTSLGSLFKYRMGDLEVLTEVNKVQITKRSFIPTP